MNSSIECSTQEKLIDEIVGMKSLPMKRQRNNPTFHEALTQFLGLNETKEEEEGAEDAEDAKD